MGELFFFLLGYAIGYFLVRVALVWWTERRHG